MVLSLFARQEAEKVQSFRVLNVKVTVIVDVDVDVDVDVVELAVFRHFLSIIRS
jgi:hypothetical protein